MNDDGQKLSNKSCQRLICKIKTLEMNIYTGKGLWENYALIVTKIIYF